MVLDIAINVHIGFSLLAVLVRDINSSSPGQNGRHFAAEIFKCRFMNEKYCISIQISLKMIPKGPIENKSALVQVMVWRRTGDKLLSEPSFIYPTDAYQRH